MSVPNIATVSGTIKLTVFGIVIALLIFFAIRSPAPETLHIVNENVKEKRVRNAIVNSLDQGDADFEVATKDLIDVGALVDPKTGERASGHENEVVLCPQYVLPILPELPELPPLEVMETVTKDQLNFILYQHIKAHQERTIEVRKRIYQSYARYLEGCE